MGLEQWMRERGVENLSHIRGSALSSLHSFEELHLEPYIASLQRECSRPGCQICIQGCMYGAIERVEGRIRMTTKNPRDAAFVAVFVRTTVFPSVGELKFLGESGIG